MKLDMKIWPKEKPDSLGNDYLIWLPSIGFLITKYGEAHHVDKDKAPYFYWCGSPKKVWWIKLEEPSSSPMTTEAPSGEGV